MARVFPTVIRRYGPLIQQASEAKFSGQFQGRHGPVAPRSHALTMIWSHMHRSPGAFSYVFPWIIPDVLSSCRQPKAGRFYVLVKMYAYALQYLTNTPRQFARVPYIDGCNDILTRKECLTEDTLFS